MGINGEIVLHCLCYEQRNNSNFWAICKQMQRICTAVLFAVILTDLLICCRCAHWRWSAVGTAQLVLVCSLIVQAALHDGSTTVWSLPRYWDKDLWHQPAPVCDLLLSICTAHVGNCSIFVLQKKQVKPNVLHYEHVIYKDTLIRGKGQVVFLPSSQAVITNL